MVSIKVDLCDFNKRKRLFSESLRKYPPLGIVFRRVTKDYFVPEYDFTLKRGTLVWIPAYAIQHDPENFPNPEKYDPERFTAEQVNERNPVTFLPFGDGIIVYSLRK